MSTLRGHDMVSIRRLGLELIESSRVYERGIWRVMGSSKFRDETYF